MHYIACALITTHYLLRNHHVTVGDLFMDYLTQVKDGFVKPESSDELFFLTTSWACHQGRTFRYTLRKMRDVELLSCTKLSDEFLKRDTDDLFGLLTSIISINEEKLTALQELFGFSISDLLQNSLHGDSIKVHPFWGNPFQIHTDIFVIMPFCDSFKPIYEDHIKRVCNKMSLTCKRADDIFSTQSVMHDIWNYIFGAKIVLCDCTDKNPNVFYELGVAHTIGKQVILLTQNENDIPFDIKHIRYVKYEYTPHGMADFENILEQFIISIMNI
jgi:hypothetical protein